MITSNLPTIQLHCISKFVSQRSSAQFNHYIASLQDHAHKPEFACSDQAPRQHPEKHPTAPDRCADVSTVTWRKQRQPGDQALPAVTQGIESGAFTQLLEKTWIVRRKVRDCTYYNDNVRSPRMLAFSSISISRFASSVSFKPSVSIRSFLAYVSACLKRSLF